MPSAFLPASLLFSRLSWFTDSEPIKFSFVSFFLSPCLSRFPHHVHNSSGFYWAYSPLLSTLHPVPASIPFPLCVPLVASTSFLLPAPSPSSSTFLSPFPSPTPFPSPFPTSTLIPPPTPFAPDRPSDSLTPSVLCACTGTGSCERSYRVPACAVPLLVFIDDVACRIKVPDRVYRSCVISCASSPLLCPP